MTHANAPLTPEGRRRLAVLITQEQWSLRRAAERFQCSPATAKRWADRYRAGLPLTDRSSRPRQCPTRLPVRTERRIVALRCNRRWGPHRIAFHLHLARSTVGLACSRAVVTWPVRPESEDLEERHRRNARVALLELEKRPGRGVFHPHPRARTAAARCRARALGGHVWLLSVPHQSPKRGRRRWPPWAISGSTGRPSWRCLRPSRRGGCRSKKQCRCRLRGIPSMRSGRDGEVVRYMSLCNLPRHSGADAADSDPG